MQTYTHFLSHIAPYFTIFNLSFCSYLNPQIPTSNKLISMLNAKGFYLLFYSIAL